MTIQTRTRTQRLFTLLTVAVSTTPYVAAQWPQWGGPQRNFTVESKPLADSWPEGGPRRLWTRELGDGYSSLICDDGVLYTMYRRHMNDTTEYTVALSAATGETLWEQAHPAPIGEPPDNRWGGNGPNSTPLVVADRLYSVGSQRALRCFEKKTGKILWEHDISKEYNLPFESSVGCCPSPIAYKNLVIVAINKSGAERATEPELIVPQETQARVEGCTLMAFDQITGKLVWRNLDFLYDYSSPILIRFADQDQLVCSCRQGLFAVDPANGDMLWHYPRQAGVPTPMWDGADGVVFASRNESRIQLTVADGRITPVESWLERKLEFNQATPVRIGDMFVGSSRQNLLGADLKTGKRLWLKRGYPVALAIVADGKLITLDQDGNLKLLRVSRDDAEVLGECKPLERFSYSTPALVGDTLYLRDRVHVMALDLGKPQQAQAKEH